MISIENFGLTIERAIFYGDSSLELIKTAQAELQSL